MAKASMRRGLAPSLSWGLNLKKEKLALAINNKQFIFNGKLNFIL
jgi:hypothetical protein